jgi:alpha-tubulin suppressor-like RCC1 family protein
MIHLKKLKILSSILISLCLLMTSNVWAASDGTTPQLKKMVEGYALFDDGSLWNWEMEKGIGTMTKMNLDQVVVISHNMTQMLALKKDGTVWAWGSNWNGERGDDQYTELVNGEIPEYRSEPLQIKSLSNIIAISAATRFSMALKSDGTVWTWGANNMGGLGDGIRTFNRDGSIQPSKDRFEPGKVESLSDIVAIDNFGQGGVALKSNGTVWAWGEFIHQLKPYQIPNLTQVQSIEDTFAITSDGSVWGWGPNDRAQYGNGLRAEDSHFEFIPVATRLAALDDFDEIEVGVNYTIGLKNGGLYSWGGNDNGSIGNGKTTIRKSNGSYWAITEDHDVLTPAKIEGLPEIHNVWTNNVTFGGVALGKDGSVWKWGGYNNADYVPMKIEFISGPLVIAPDSKTKENDTPVTPFIESKENVTPSIKSKEFMVIVNGSTLSFDQPPIEVNGRIKVPLRAIFDALGAKITWNNSTNTVTAIKGDTIVILTTGQLIATVNGKKITLDQPADVINNRILVPIRFVTESFGGNIIYDKDTKTIKISTVVELN